MEKDKLIEEMLKDMGDRNNTIDLNAYGRGLIDMYDRVVKNCSIPVVVGQSEQCFCERELGTTKDGKCLEGCYYNDK